MDETTASTQADPESPPMTAPNNFNICLRGFDTKERAELVGERIGGFVRELSRFFDLSGLDGVTVAHDYAQALIELDRGYSTSYRLTPTDGDVVGIAMSPSVLREGILKSHVVLNAGLVIALEDSEHEEFPLALHVLAHECAHVEITQTFDKAFPGFLLRETHPDFRSAFRWQVILACWDEYAATRLSWGIGRDPTEDYEDTFLRCLNAARGQANEHIKQYRTHGDVDRILADVFREYGALVKFTAYHLGNLAGKRKTVSEMPRTMAALENHWFEPFITRLDTVLNGIMENYGVWKDQLAFEDIGDLAEEILVEGGVHIKHVEGTKYYIDIPFSDETMPG